MASFRFCPSWFSGNDTFIDLFSFITLLILFLFSLSFYKISKKKSYFWISIAFLILSGSFLSRFFTYLLIYFYQPLQLKSITIVEHMTALKIGGIRFTYFIFSTGIIVFNFLHLAGFYLFYLSYRKNVKKTDIFIVLSLFLVITYFSHNSYFAFHFSALALILGILVLLRKSNVLIKGSFIFIALSQALFIFKTFDPFFYFFGDLFQLIGYFLLLFAFIKIRKNGKKAK